MKKTKYTPRNWDRMTKAQKRVAIAKDVIAQVHAGLLLATPGEYVDFCSEDFGHSSEEQFCDVSEKLRCHACALGGAWLSYLRFVNDKTVREASRDDEGIRHVGIFTTRQLHLIEDAFESTWGHFYNAEDRLIAIFQNVIDHEGTFKPKVLYEVTEVTA